MAIISHAKIGAGHDGAAELIVTIRYDNGGTTDVCLDEAAAGELMTNCKNGTLEELTGLSWQCVREALKTSYNRFQTNNQ